MRWALVILAFATAGLVLFGVATIPHFFDGERRWIGVVAAVGIVLAYGAAAWLAIPGLRRGPSGILRVAGPTGLAAGAVYAAEVIGEYVVRPADNTPWGLVEFGLVFALMALAGAILAWRTGRLRPALAGGLWTALTGPLIWYAVVLSVFYLFRGTAAQEAVLRAEGDYEDFARAGGGDFQVFVMQDFLGAGFYHLLLSPLFGLVLGAVGAAPILWLRRGRAGPTA
jgi:hypothetical protein